MTAELAVLSVSLEAIMANFYIPCCEDYKKVSGDLALKSMQMYRVSALKSCSPNSFLNNPWEALLEN